MKETAVEFLIKELGEYFPVGIGGVELMVEKAKEIEKENAIYLVHQLTKCHHKTVEDRYNEIFKSK